MENASKALIIAGAILLSILIISLGIMIFSQAQGVVQDSSISEFEVTQFNQKFQSYTGPNVRGAQVNSLINTVVQNNVANQDDDSKQVKINVTSSNWTGTKPTDSAAVMSQSAAGSAKTGKTYNVTYSQNAKTGFIDVITIADPGKTE